MPEMMENVIKWTGESRLNEFLQYHYDLRIIRAKPLAGVLNIETDQGAFVLKRIRPGQKDRWQFILELGDYLEQKDVMIPKPILTKNKKPFFNGFHHRYVLLPWIDAQPVRLHHLDEWKQVSRYLAFVHQSSQDFVPTLFHRKFQQTGRWSSQFKQAHRQIELFQLAAKWTHQPTDADITWLDYATYTQGIMENLLEYFTKMGGDSVCKETAQYGNICHNNLHRGNIVSDREQQIYLVDWADVICDIRVRDLTQWLLYAYGRTGSIRVLSTILSGYQEMTPLSESEFALIYVQMLFPEQLFQVLKAIYGEQSLSLDQAKPYILAAAQKEEKKLVLLKKFVKLVKKKWKISIPEIDWIKKRKK
ncbi:phosphotransferase [Thermoflavimicrobium dichotomicum]|uniref:Spore coat protein, CotS family n=1 Tax=Thermoflavimicrobium dichotomicum TaxID=46223 RepID=A0A1I3LR29_9BACL|nr:phosphotransferase [Thermoflavimicrobium dichotomicum]SFI87152.1 spore coat protein, CotS family [Thermoflavimicrobium dichotomicum]